MDQLQTTNNPQKAAFSPKELIFRYIRFLPMIILSVIISLTLAFLKIRYSNPIYNVSGKLLVKDQNPYSNNADKFGDIFMMQGSADNLADEIEVITSRNMALRVVRSLGLQVQYSMKGNVRTSLAHVSDVPFEFVIQRIDSSSSHQYDITIVNNDQYRIGEISDLYNFNQQVTRPEAVFTLRATQEERMTPVNEFIITWYPEVAISRNLSSGLQVVRSEGANVLNLTYPTENIKIGLEIVNQYMKEYQTASLEDKQEIALNTLDFIDDQLDTLQIELGGVERNLQQFRERNQVYNPEQQSELYFGQITESVKQLTEQSVRLKVIDYLINYLTDSRNTDKTVPSNLGIEEPSLTQQILNFNTLQLEKETALKSTPAGNPLIQNLEIGITKLRQDIVENLRNVRQTYLVSIAELEKRNATANDRISSMPKNEKQLLEVSRQQNILQELYSFLLQKKLETSISSASTISNIKVLEPAMAASIPTSPKRMSSYLIALFLGLAIPIGVIFLLDYLNDKVTTKDDITNATSVPILGEVGHSEYGDVLLVKENNRSFIAEQFRIIRSNLQYVLPKNEKPVILITSSFSGEGKSFISTNIGAVLALSGKKTVILEFDIRKPKILKGLGLHESKGITNYIVSPLSVSQITYPVPNIDNLFVIPCGPVPPNPAELLLDEKIGLLIDELKNSFDAIIIDTAPVGLVSDAITLSAHANAAIYIIRHNYTFKRQIKLIDDLYQNHKMPRMSIVINDISNNWRYGGNYGYGYGYGYGYSYGKDSGYYSDTRKGFLSKLKKFAKF